MKSIAIILAGLVLLQGCETRRISTSDGRPLPPQPREAPATPATAVADRMVFTVGSKPEDTNGNGYPDSIKISVSLFSIRHPMAMRQDGVFVFELYPQGQFGASGAKPIGTWRIESASDRALTTRTLAGPAYLFHLSLLETGSDVLPLERADLVCRFEPVQSGAPQVTSDGVRTIQIGKKLTASGQ